MPGIWAPSRMALQERFLVCATRCTARVRIMASVSGSTRMQLPDMRSIGDSRSGPFTMPGQRLHTPQRFVFPSPGTAPTSSRSSVLPESRSFGSSIRFRGTSPTVRLTDWTLSGSTWRAKLTVCCSFLISPGIGSRPASAARRTLIAGRAVCRSILATTLDQFPRTLRRPRIGSSWAIPLITSTSPQRSTCSHARFRVSRSWFSAIGISHARPM